MTYNIFWQIPDQVLCMELEGHLQLDDFNQINYAVISHLDSVTENPGIALLISAARLNGVPQAFQQLRASQTYVERRDLTHIVVVTTNKMVRLMMLLTFNLSRPSLRFFDDLDHAHRFLQMVQLASAKQAGDS